MTKETRHAHFLGRARPEDYELNPVKPKIEIRFTDAGFAVFNCHVNNAGERAMNICRKFYMNTPELADLEKSWQKGIMEIFQKEPTEITRLFATSCMIFANGLDRDYE